MNMDEFFEAYNQMNAMKLDRLGIYIKVDELPSMSAKRRAILKLYGNGWLDHLYRIILYRLFPDIKKRRQEKAKFLNLKVHQEYLSAVMDAAEDLLDRAI